MRIATYVFAALVCVDAVRCLAAPVSINLDFNAPVPSAVNDVNGLGTGFATRLTGTGAAIPANDPNMDLLASPGKLLLTSTHSNLGGLALPTDNFPTAEAPGFFLSGVGTNDIQISAGLRDVNVLNGSDQISVYAAIDGTQNVRAAVHELNAFVLSVNDGTGDVNVVSTLGIFSTGDDIDVTLSRSTGLWTLSWHNLTNASMGSLPSVAVPWLDAQSDLSVGVHAANPGLTQGGQIQSFVAQFDYFSVNVVPEPSSVVLFGLGAAVLLLAARRRAS